jgi:hypothetical protein
MKLGGLLLRKNKFCWREEDERWEEEGGIFDINIVKYLECRGHFGGWLINTPARGHTGGGGKEKGDTSQKGGEGEMTKERECWRSEIWEIIEKRGEIDRTQLHASSNKDLGLQIIYVQSCVNLMLTALWCFGWFTPNSGSSRVYW